MASIQRSLTEGRVPRRGDAVLIGQAASGGLVRLRIPRRYRLFDALMVRAFIKQKVLDRLGIVIGDDFEQGKPNRFLVALVDRADVEVQGGSSDPRLARLARAAGQAWSGKPPPVWSVLGRPWEVAFLVFILSAELVVTLLRVRWVLAGSYSWLPIIPTAAASAAYPAYLALIAVTLVALWRQTRLGYVLALCLAAVQFVRPIALIVPVMQSIGPGRLALWLAWSWILPAGILFGLGVPYLERRAGAEGSVRDT